MQLSSYAAHADFPEASDLDKIEAASVVIALKILPFKQVEGKQ